MIRFIMCRLIRIYTLCKNIVLVCIAERVNDFCFRLILDNYRNYYSGEERRRPRFKSIRERWRARKMVCAWTLVKVALVLCVLSLIFQILGYSCPGWLVLTIDLSVVGAQPGSSLYGIGQVVTYAAVWYVRVCTKEGLIESCSSSSYHDATFMGLQLSTALTGIEYYGINCSKSITKTRLYNFDPLKPHFYIVKLGFTGLYITFLILLKKHRLWILIRSASPRRF